MVKKISIIVPAHNEEKRIGNMLDLYLNFFKKLKTVDFEIIVVLNACKDKTKQEVMKRKTKELRVLDFEKGGKGFAVVQGFKDALLRDSDVMGFVDADASTKPEEFYKLVKNMKDNDGAIASRYIPGAKMDPAPTLQRMIVSRIYNLVIRALFIMPYRDTQCGAKVFKRKLVSEIVNQIGMTKWAFDVEILFKSRKAGFIVIEVPTFWSDKDYSKINALTAGPMMVLGIVRLRILSSPLKMFIRVYDFFAESVRKWMKK
ncbi:MAG TPA: glycosyltransferase [Candidatus Nanoarchaeia archaeon]|nr:glycosyltransferase [Candidatus Nanoarchaeia archaeon]